MRIATAAILATLASLAALPASAEAVTPPGTWLKVIKSTVRLSLDDGEKAKFSRVFFAGSSTTDGTYPVCGRVISQETGDTKRTMRYFHGVMALPGDFDHPVFLQIKVGKAAADTSEIWQTCLRLQLL